jgi:hypothetical protein
LAELGEESKARVQIEVLGKKPELSSKAIIAKADVAWRMTRDSQQVLQIYKSGLASHADDAFLLTMFAMQVGTSTPETAKETVPVLESLENSRQLAPEEYVALIHGLLVLNLPERAERVLGRAVERYPEDSRFIFEQSSVQWMLGNEEAAYQSVKEYLTHKKGYHALRECAVLARDTGRLSEAINLFELASRRATTPEERGSIQSQLYILKKLRGDAPKEILRHAYEFGKTTHKDPEKDAQYFMMFLTAPGGADVTDPEIWTWCTETQSRMQEFSALHPQFPSFRTFKIDESKPIGDQFKDAITDIIAKTLPRELATTPIRMAARSQNWPLALRAKYYPGIHSIFEMWDKCIKSKEYEYGLHIWTNENNQMAELKAAERHHETCIDITGLLTLAELNLLDIFSASFERIYLARGTKHLLVVEKVSLQGAHPLSEKIEEWRIKNISKIRVLPARQAIGKTAWDNSTAQAKAIVQQREALSLDQLLGDGIGESLLLSRRLCIPLFSDESSVRIWADSDYGVEAFSTFTFLKFLSQSSRLTKLSWISLQAEMIKRNFRTIPFEAGHLIEPLKELVKIKGNNVTYTDLREHPILNVYLNEFVETVITIDSLARVASDWWFAIVFDRDLPVECLQRWPRKFGQSDKW